MTSLASWQLAGFLFLHLGALATAIGTRVAAGTRFESLFQCLFLVALAAVGMAAWQFPTEQLGVGIPSGMTLIAMVLVAVTDLRRTHEPHHPHALAVHR